MAYTTSIVSVYSDVEIRAPRSFIHFTHFALHVFTVVYIQVVITLYLGLQNEIQIRDWGQPHKIIIILISLYAIELLIWCRRCSEVDAAGETEQQAAQARTEVRPLNPQCSLLLLFTM